MRRRRRCLSAAQFRQVYLLPFPAMHTVSLSSKRIPSKSLRGLGVMWGALPDSPYSPKQWQCLPGPFDRVQKTSDLVACVMLEWLENEAAELPFVGRLMRRRRLCLSAAQFRQVYLVQFPAMHTASLSRKPAEAHPKQGTARPRRHVGRSASILVVSEVMAASAENLRPGRLRVAGMAGKRGCHTSFCGSFDASEKTLPFCSTVPTSLPCAVSSYAYCLPVKEACRSASQARHCAA